MKFPAIKHGNIRVNDIAIYFLLRASKADDIYHFLADLASFILFSNYFFHHIPTKLYLSESLFLKRVLRERKMAEGSVLIFSPSY